ncbi:MAG: glycosyltransferase [Nitrosopumilus sp.]|nr:glycosyltransferase [Nitrosopumilus sp.]NRA04645.1 glycosyltransferase [Nitrosopumilus sp.]
MKVLYAGNTANIGYNVVYHIRKINVNIELLMQKNPRVDSDPIVRDSTLNKIYPKWINFYDKTKSLWKINILKKMQNYDLILANSSLILYAYFSHKPYIIQPIGSELRVTAFSKSLKGFLMRRSLRKANVVIIATPASELLIKKLKIKNYFMIPCHPEISFFNPGKTLKTDFNDNFTIFHPTNLNWKEKGNDILIKGVAIFLKKYPKTTLLIVEHGIDLKKTYELIKKLDIEKNIKFIKGPLIYEQLKFYYHNADVVADQFIGSEIGAIGREVLCSQKPLLANFDKVAYETQFDTAPPIMRANTPDEVCSKLELLLDDETRDKYGKDGRLWMEKNNLMDAFVGKYKIICKSVISKENFEILKTKIDNFENS